MTKRLLSLLFLCVCLGAPSVTTAHQHGCHRLHSCPSDTGSYVCGDLGYCAQCPQNQYCPGSPGAVLPQDTFSGLVVGLSDGDTISVLRDGKAVKVRLQGIDTPESQQAFGTRAQQFASELAFNTVVTVVVSDTDRYGRLVGEVFLPEGRSLNQELVRAGLGWWYRQYAPNDTTLQRLEAEAREAQRGLWSDPQAVAPWEWRRERK